MSGRLTRFGAVRAPLAGALALVLACGARAENPARIEEAVGSRSADDVGHGETQPTSVLPAQSEPVAEPVTTEPLVPTAEDSGEGALASHCTNFVHDANETYVDCGGPDCSPCGLGANCQSDGDCLLGRCDGGLCYDLSCYDGIQGPYEALVDCDGGCKPCAVQLTDCPCASSEGLRALACGGRVRRQAHTAQDGAVVAFSACAGRSEDLQDLGRCDVVRWTLGSGSELIAPDALPRGSSSDGQIVLIQAGTAGLWRADTGLTPLPLETALSLSDDGRIVLGETGVEAPRAARWTSADGVLPLEFGALPANAERAKAVTLSGDGSAIVGYWSDAESRPLDVFRWTEAGGFTDTAVRYFSWDPTPRGGLFSSTDGSAIAGTLDFDADPNVGYSFAFRWTEGNDPLLEWRDAEPNQVGIIQGLSADGRRVFGTLFDGAMPFLWEENRGLWRLDESLRAAGASLEGWNLTDAIALSGDGRVVIGSGFCGGLQATFRAVLPD